MTTGMRIDPTAGDRGAGNGAFVAGIYNHCDQWCAYCPATARCLAHRVFLERQAQQGDDDFADLAQVVAFTREVAAMAGAATPELDALLAGNGAGQLTLPIIDDPLERLGHRYAADVGQFLRRRRWTAPADWQAAQPSPLDVLAWYHVLVPAKIGRALIGVAQASRGQADRWSDAHGSAKVAIIGLDRSRVALADLGEAADVRVIRRLAERLASMVEARFPDARGFARPGLDAPVV